MRLIGKRMIALKRRELEQMIAKSQPKTPAEKAAQEEDGRKLRMELDLMGAAHANHRAKLAAQEIRDRVVALCLLVAVPGAFYLLGPENVLGGAFALVFLGACGIGLYRVMKSDDERDSWPKH